MKLTILIHGASIGGGELYVERVRNELQKYFDEIVIYSWHQEIPHLKKIFAGDATKYSRISFLGYLLLFLELVRGRTQIWLTSGIRDLPILFLLFFLRTKLSGSIYIQSKPALKSNILSKALHKIYLSSILFLKRKGKINLSFSSQTLARFYIGKDVNGSNVTIISPLLNTSLKREDLNFSSSKDGHLNLLIVSRLYDPLQNDDQKGLAFVFEVIKLLSLRFDTITLFWRGAGDVKIIIDNLRSVNNITVDFRFVDRFWLNVPSDAIFFAPSKSEGFGLAYLECQLLGFSCVVSSAFDETADVSKRVFKAITYDPNEFLTLILKARLTGVSEEELDISKIEYSISSERNAEILFKTIVGE